MNKRKLLEKALAGSRNIRFSDLVALIEALGFSLARINGSHHIFQHPLVTESINVQNVNGQAKPYQIRQVIKIIEDYGLSLEQDNDKTGETQGESDD